MNRFSQTLALCCCLVLWGCPVTFKSIRTFSEPTAQQYREKALADEKHGRPQEALLNWRVAALLDPNDKKIPKIIDTLDAATRNAARSHFQRGLEHFTAGQKDKARQAFLVALRLMPTLTRARTWLKHDLNAGGHTIYEVKTGDSYSKIALKTFNDPTKAYTIAYFNGLDPEKPLMIRKRLILPRLDKDQILPHTDIQALVTQAESALKEKRFDEVVRLVERIKAEAPAHTKAGWLADTAHFRNGLAFMQKKQYQAALDQFRLVNSSYEGRDRAMDTAMKQLRSLAEAHNVKKARESLNQKDFTSAIRIAEDVLTQNPKSPGARSVARTARYNLGRQLIEEDKELTAIDVLSKLDPAYEDTAQLIAQARGKLNARAEALYRSGVKHFLNEELEQAIQDWKAALKLNPNHPKAAQDIEDAERLLQKWRGLEKTE